MGREGDAKESIGTQRIMGVRMVVMVATSVLLSAQASTALYSQHNICALLSSSITLIPYETVFLGTNKLQTYVSLKADGCVNVTQKLSLWQNTVSNETSWPGNLRWYEFTNCENFVAKIGSEIVKFRPPVISSRCNNKPITLSVEPSVVLGRICLMAPPQLRRAACKILQPMPGTDRRQITKTKPVGSSLEEMFHLDQGSKTKTLDPFRFATTDNDNDAKSIYDTPGLYLDDQPGSNKWGFDRDILQATPAPLPTYNVHGNYFDSSDSGFSKRRNYKENAIPIFIGIVLLTVSMCLRFCLCRGKSVVQRVTTVTVIRARPAGSSDAPQDQQDPPPSYIDVVNETASPQNLTNECSIEPPPPAYADIVDENLPPTYSEVEAQSQSTTSEVVPLANQDAEEHTTQPPSDPEAVSDVKTSAPPSKNVLSKYRSQQKQFAFKMLEEDE